MFMTILTLTIRMRSFLLELQYGGGKLQSVDVVDG